jgi:tRNA(Ile)-lysidine synthetase-like protein
MLRTMMCSAMETNPPSDNREPAHHKSSSSAATDCIQTIHLALRQFFEALHIGQQSSTPLLLAVSGGPDSLCMADAIIAMQDELHVAPVIAHLDHQLRGEAARADAEFVRAFAFGKHVPCIVEQIDVGEWSRTQRVSIEVAARTARYRFLASVAHSIGTRYITIAHNADDQAETILLRLLRGTGIYGLQGMRPVHPLQASPENAEPLTLLRPLLGIHRPVIDCYCRQRDLSPRHDVTNEELHHTRNRIRHELLPLLEQYNPGIRKVLVRLADTAATDSETIDYATQHVFQGLLVPMPGDQPLTLNRTAWCALPVGLQRATLREAVRRVQHHLMDLKFAGVEEARDVLNSSARTAEISILDDVCIVVRAHEFAVVSSTPYN